MKIKITCLNCNNLVGVDSIEKNKSEAYKIELHGECQCRNELRALTCEDMSETGLTTPAPQVAKELSIKKWECIINAIKNDYKPKLSIRYVKELLLMNDPNLFLELRYYRGLCPLCGIYADNCAYCPVGKVYGDCDDPDSPYFKFVDDDGNTKEKQLLNAQLILEIIKEWDAEASV